MRHIVYTLRLRLRRLRLHEVVARRPQTVPLPLPNRAAMQVTKAAADTKAASEVATREVADTKAASEVVTRVVAAAVAIRAAATREASKEEPTRAASKEEATRAAAAWAGAAAMEEEAEVAVVAAIVVAGKLCRGLAAGHMLPLHHLMLSLA